MLSEIYFLVNDKCKQCSPFMLRITFAFKPEEYGNLPTLMRKKSLVFIFNVSTLRFIEIISGSIKLEASM